MLPPTTRHRPIPLVLRFAGLWLIWCAWASASGWCLSAFGILRPMGYAMTLPVLVLAWIAWWKHHRTTTRTPLKFVRRGRFRWLVNGFRLTACLTLIGALIHTPWSYDAVSYRLPRILYWLAEHRWYWIGTIDGRLDYSGTGLEWQSIPLLLVTQSDRGLFLLSYLPYLMLPGLTFLSGRALGQKRRHAMIMMWLLPAAYCIGLQAGGLQNDGYSVAFTLSAMAFAGRALAVRCRAACGLAILAAALLTGAKVSNLPLMLPLGVWIACAIHRCDLLKWKWLPALPAAAAVSFVPLAVLAWIHTGDWTGDPNDQWGFRTKNPVAAIGANLVLWGNDLTQPPVLVGAALFHKASEAINTAAAPVWSWFMTSHRMFRGVQFGDLTYEGSAGPGFGMGLFMALSLLGGSFFTARYKSQPLPLISRLVLGGAIIAWLVYLAKLGTDHSARNAAPYYPLLLLAFCRIPPVRSFLDSRWCPQAVLLCTLSIIPIIILTPARPLIPLALLDRLASQGPLAGKASPIAKKYHVWEDMRDDLKDLRKHLPDGVSQIGYAGGFRDTAYGLWKPLGSRVVDEIGIRNLRTASQSELPPYVVATRRGIEQRYATGFEAWCETHRAVPVHTESRSLNLDADTAENREDWYLLKIGKRDEP